MAATPEAPVSLLVMMLLRYVDRIAEDLRAQRIPEARPNPDWEGPLISDDPQQHNPEQAQYQYQSPQEEHQPQPQPSPARQPRRSRPARDRPPPRSQAPAPDPGQPQGPPPRRDIPAPVGERHNRRIPQDVKIAVSARDGGRCRQCGSIEKLQFDHIIPASKGGANTVANIQLLCGRCNRTKAAK